MTHRYVKAQLQQNIQDPFKYLALSVLQRAILDKDIGWLMGDSFSLCLWRDTTDVEPAKLSEAVDYWFGEQKGDSNNG